MASKQKSFRRRDIQILRGLSVLAVIFYHANQNIFKVGYLGVDIFFVISGFVILPTLVKNLQSSKGVKITLIEFYKRRFFRLYPGLVSSLVISSMILWLCYSPEYFSRISDQGIASLLFMGNIGAILYSGDYFAPNPNPLVHLWSLAVEGQIYLAIAPLLILLIMIKIKIQSALIFITTLGLTYFLFSPSQNIMSWIGYPNEYQASFYLPFDRFWQFLIGGLCGILSLNKINKILESRLNYSFVLLFCTLIIILEPNNNKIGSFFATFLAVTFIIGNKLSNYNLNWLIWIGDRSYSLYLIHMPIFSVVNYSPATTVLLGENKILHFIVGAIFTAVISNMNYLYFEKRYRLNSSIIKSQKLKLVLTGLLLSFSLTIFLQLGISANKMLLKFQQENNIKAPAWDLDLECDRMTSTGPPCLYNLGASTNAVLLIGDSHAAQYSQTIVNLGFERKFPVVIWTQASCPFTLNNFSNISLPKGCLDNNKSKMKWIIEQKPTNVIVSYYMVNGYDTSGLIDSLKMISLNAKNVILIENNPEFPDPELFLQQLPIIVPSYSNTKNFQIQEMDSTNNYLAENLYSEARKIGIKTIDVSPQICKNGKCSRWSKGDWLYGDANHLSIAGAELLKPLLIKVLM